jgi:cytochrome b
MHNSGLIASVITVLFVLALVFFRLLWGAEQVAAAAGLGRLPRLPKRLENWIRRWLFGKHEHASGKQIPPSI